MSGFFFSSRDERYRIAREHWRVFAVAALGQAVGAFVSALVVQPSASVFLNLWVGGALASAPGVLVGLAWHLASAERRASTSWELVAFILAVSIGMSVMASTFDLSMFDPETAPF